MYVNSSSFVSKKIKGLWQACCVNQYHYESQLIHTTGKTWYIVLYQHTMYVISLSNISIKAHHGLTDIVERCIAQRQYSSQLIKLNIFNHI
jgi:hypothetical protein